MSVYASFNSALIHIHAATHINSRELPFEYSFLSMAAGQLQSIRWGLNALLKGTLEVVCLGRRSYSSLALSDHIYVGSLSFKICIYISSLSYQKCFNFIYFIILFIF